MRSFCCCLDVVLLPQSAPHTLTGGMAKPLVTVGIARSLKRRELMH